MTNDTLCSVRVANELGAGNAKAAKFSVVVVSITTILIGVVCMVVVLATKDFFPYFFTNSEAVAKETTRLSTLLALTVLLNGLQPVLSGTDVAQGELRHRHPPFHSFFFLF